MEEERLAGFHRQPILQIVQVVLTGDLPNLRKHGRRNAEAHQLAVSQSVERLRTAFCHGGSRCLR